MSPNADGTVSWRELHQEAIDRLARVSTTPQVDARRIVERAGGIDPGAFALELDTPVTVRQVAWFDRMIDARLTGKPLQYVLGVWSFRTLDLFVDQRVLIPRPETEIVVEHALREYDRVLALRNARRGTVADIGTGSGAIALSVAIEREGTTVWATDDDEGAVEVARSNLAGLGRPARFVNVVRGSFFDPLPADLASTIDVVVSNPPYVAASEELEPIVRDWEPRHALVAGPSGYECYEMLVPAAREWLRPEGALVLEIGSTQGERVGALLRDCGYSDVVIACDLVGRERVAIGRWS